MLMMVESSPRAGRATRRVPADAAAVGAVVLEWLGLGGTNVHPDGADASVAVAIQVAVAEPGMASGPRQIVLFRQQPGVVRRDAVTDRTRVETGDVAIDTSARTVRRETALVEVTGVEFDLLRVLVSRVGTVVSRDCLSREVLGRSCDPGDRSIDVHVGRLRRKLGPHPCGCPRIRTVRGLGYVYTAVSQASA